MLARLAPELPQGNAWVYEPKLDGFRGCLSKQTGTVRVLSRNRRELTARFPELVAAAERQLPDGCILDGEIVGFRDRRPDFTILLNRWTRAGTDMQTCFIAFDMIESEGRDLRRSHWSNDGGSSSQF
jgi:ATP-dependent DNA ligase